MRRAILTLACLPLALTVTAPASAKVVTLKEQYRCSKAEKPVCYYSKQYHVILTPTNLRGYHSQRMIERDGRDLAAQYIGPDAITTSVELIQWTPATYRMSGTVRFTRRSYWTMTARNTTNRSFLVTISGMYQNR